MKKLSQTARRRISMLLSIVCCIALLVCSFAFFTDKLTAETAGTAGNIDLVFKDVSLATEHQQAGQDNNINKVWSGRLIQEGSIMNPGDTFDMGYKLTNTGSKSVDVRQQLTLTSSVPMTADAYEYQLKCDNITLIPNVNEDKTVIVYTIDDIVLTGSKEANPDFEGTDAIDGVAGQDFDLYLDFARHAKNAFMDSNISIKLDIQAKQHRNTDNGDWAPWESYSSSFESISVASENLLDVDNLVTIKSYITNSSELKHSLGNVKTFILPVEAGATYTISRKNAGYTLSAGCGTDLWLDDSNHTLLNYVYSADSKTLSITVPETGCYLYVYYYNDTKTPDIESYDAIIEELSVIKNVEHATNPTSKILGVEFNNVSTNPVGVRLCDARPLIASSTYSDFDNIYPWSEMKRCNLTIENGVKHITYEGESGFTLDGSNGPVMVEIPVFYVAREVIGDVERLYISETSQDGFDVHPWFLNNDGTAEDYRYYGAYNASNESLSASGYLPYSNLGKNATFFRSLANQYGFSRNTIHAVSAIQYLFTIEYATRDSQSVFNGSTYNPYIGNESGKVRDVIDNNTLKLSIGSYYSGNSFLFYSPGMQIYITENSYSDGETRNITAITHDDDYVYITVDGDPITLSDGLKCAGSPQKTGLTDSLSSFSGVAPNRDTLVASFRYRYIENPWGNIWEVVDGITLQNGKYYINNIPLSYAAPMKTATDHSVDNWIKRMGYDSSNPIIGLPTELISDPGRVVSLKTDAGETIRNDIILRGEKYYCDAFYSDDTTSSPYILMFGGGWDHHENAGLYCYRFLPNVALNPLYGERITY